MPTYTVTPHPETLLEVSSAMRACVLTVATRPTSWTFAVSRGRAPEDCHTFQKFALVA